MSKPIQATTREYTGNTTFPASQNRDYFFIAMTSGTGTVRFGDEGGEIPLDVDTKPHYNPPVALATSITVTTTGTFVVHTDEHA